MKKMLFYLPLLLAVVFTTSFQLIRKKPVKLFLIGDSTVADYTLYEEDYQKKRYPIMGWGQVFQPFMHPDSLAKIRQLIKSDSVLVLDKARGGRSTRTFFEEGRWAEVYRELSKGDLVMIQFGHNDAAENKPERYVSIQGYKEYLRLFVNQTREKGAQPILLTPVNRNYPWKEGKLQNVHGDYPGAVKEVAAELGVPLIDLTQLSIDHFTARGQEYVSKQYFMNLPAGVYEAYPEGQKDNTHFQPEGAKAVAQLVFKGMQTYTIPRDTSYTLHSAYQKYKKSYPFIKPVASAVPKGVQSSPDRTYRSLGPRKLQLDVFYPQKKQKGGYPGVLLIHGGGWRTGDKALVHPMAQQLAAKGYVTAAVEYRLSPEAPYPAAVHDIKAALRWLRAHAAEFKLDTSRVAVYGTSAGGQLAALIGTTNGLKEFEGDGDYLNHSSGVQAIIDVDGVLAFKHPESEEGTVAAQWLGGTFEEAPENWQQASALTHAGKNTPPILFISSSYPRFHAGKADMIKILQGHQIYTESHAIPDSPHSFWLFHPWFEANFQYTLNFLDKVLKPKQASVRH